MSFFASLSGLKAAQANLGVISNNIANVSTTGFKGSSAQFGDLISSAPLQTSTVPGQGTEMRDIQQQFTQGGFQNTDRSLDLAISGQGFFMTRATSTDAQVSYTRDGSFSINSDRYLVDSTGAYLQVLPTDAKGVVTASGLNATRSLQLPLTSGTSSATSAVTMAVNLPTDADVPSTRSVYTANNPYTFDRFDPNSYNQSTTTTVYDASGNSFPMTTYYSRLTTPTSTNSTSTWSARTFIGDKEVSSNPATPTPPTPLTLTFDSFGSLTSPTASTQFANVVPTGATGPIGVNLAYGATTKQSSAPFSLTAFSQDGYAAGQLDNVSVGSDGLVAATFSNGTTVDLGKIVLASFANPEGLRQVGNAKWTSTGISGEAVVGQANANGLGTVQSGALEQSNVDITSELVSLIQAQQNFSANAKAIDTANKMTDTIVSLQS